MMVRLFPLIGFVFLAGCLGERLGFGELTCDDNSECVYRGPSSSDLMWQGCPAGQSGEDCTGTPEGKEHAEAVTYCEELEWGGFDDWELPNIDELQSLIAGCTQNEYGSSECSITHQCSYSTNNENTCRASVIGGCTPPYCHELEGPRSDGCYLPVDLPGSCKIFFSSSRQSAPYVYFVNFNLGLVMNGPGSNGKVRCVRSQP